MKYLTRSYFLIVVALSFACSSQPEDRNSNDELNLDNYDADADISHDTADANEQTDDADSGAWSPQVDFILINNTTDDLYFQSRTAGVPNQPAWLEVNFNGEQLVLGEPCLYCPCDGLICSICFDTDDSVGSITPGAELDFPWEGTFHTLVPDDDDEMCFEAELVSPGTMTATICYGFETEPNDEGTVVVDPVCETLEFDPGVDTRVEYSVSD